MVVVKIWSEQVSLPFMWVDEFLNVHILTCKNTLKTAKQQEDLPEIWRPLEEITFAHETTCK